MLVHTCDASTRKRNFFLIFYLCLRRYVVRVKQNNIRTDTRKIRASLSVSGDAPKKLVSQTHVTFRAHSSETIPSILIPTEEVWVHNFPAENRRKLPKEHDCRLFCLFRTNRYSVYSLILLSGAELTDYYSVHPGSNIPPSPCILIVE